MAAKSKTERRNEKKAKTWQPKEDVVFIDVENPFYSRAHNVSRTNPRFIKASHNVKESAITSMAARGHLSVAQVRAAKTFCSLWEALGGSGARAIDYSREPVDGGKNPEAMTDKQMRAGQELKKCSSLLGVLGYELVCKIAGMGMSLEDVAGKERRRRDHAADSLRGCLEVLAVHLGVFKCQAQGVDGIEHPAEAECLPAVLIKPDMEEIKNAGVC